MYSQPFDTFCSSDLVGAQKNAAIEHLQSGIADMDARFRPIYETCREYTMTSADRMYAVYSAINFLIDNQVQGDVVECGVWRGGSMMVAAMTLASREIFDRRLRLFDTFEGLPAPVRDLDVDLHGNQALDTWAQTNVDGKNVWAFCDIDTVRSNMSLTSYPDGKTFYCKGLVEDTIPKSAPENIAFLRIDTDWYSSVSHLMNHLYDRVVPGGVIIIDDYGHFVGAKKAVDEFLYSRKIKPYMHRIDYTGRMFFK